jgi:hypothetical protein
MREYLRISFAIRFSKNFLDRAKAIAGVPAIRAVMPISCHPNDMDDAPTAPHR